MGRPREHDERTRTALLDTAERIVEHGGLEALSVRRVADESGTSTRAIYSVFGSKAGLVGALGGRAFEWLAAELDALALTDDPTTDVVNAGAVVFRRLVVEHPQLFQLGVQRVHDDPQAARTVRASADDAMLRLTRRLGLLEECGRLQGRTIAQAALEFHALCEGLAALELRAIFPPHEAQSTWHNALSTLVEGWAFRGGRDTLPAAPERSAPRLRVSER